MKKNKGFSLVELVIAFSLTTIVVVILFQIVVSLKATYTGSLAKDDLINNKNIMIEKIYNDINNNCSSVHYTYDFTVPNTVGICCDSVCKDLMFDNLALLLKYGDDYTAKYPEGTIFGTGEPLSFLIKYNGISISSVELPIHNKIIPNEDFGLNIISLTPQ